MMYETRISSLRPDCQSCSDDIITYDDWLTYARAITSCPRISKSGCGGLCSSAQWNSRAAGLPTTSWAPMGAQGAPATGIVMNGCTGGELMLVAYKED